MAQGEPSLAGGWMRRNTTVPVHLTCANGAEEAAGPLSKYCDKTKTESVGV